MGEALWKDMHSPPWRAASASGQTNFAGVAVACCVLVMRISLLSSPSHAATRRSFERRSCQVVEDYVRNPRRRAQVDLDRKDPRGSASAIAFLLFRGSLFCSVASEIETSFEVLSLSRLHDSDSHGHPMLTDSRE